MESDGIKGGKSKRDMKRKRASAAKGCYRRERRKSEELSRAPVG